MGDPKILILDEPTVGLDPSQVIEIRKLVKSLAKNHSIVISSHILSEIQAICDRVVIINNGKVAAIDTISDLSKRLSGTAKLLLTIRGIGKDALGRIRVIPGVSEAKLRRSDNDIHEIEISVTNDQKSGLRESIFYSMAQAGFPILEFRSLDPTLEEIFLSITG